VDGEVMRDARIVAAVVNFIVLPLLYLMQLSLLVLAMGKKKFHGAEADDESEGE